MNITKSLVTLTLLCSVVVSNAQKEVSIAVPNSKWINSVSEYNLKDAYNRSNIKSVVSTAYCIEENDSLIKGIKYLKVNDCLGKYIGCIREENRRTFLVKKGASIERLIYDFSVSRGDTIKLLLIRDKLNSTNYNVHSDIVTSVDSVEIYGEARKRINFEKASWVEGIGNVDGFLTGHYGQKLKYDFDLTCMSSNNKMFYPEAQAGVCDLPADIRYEGREVTELLYPKNMNSKFTMDFKRVVKKNQVLVINNKGKVITPKIKVNKAEVVVDLSIYKKGNYIVLVRSGNGLALARLIKN